MKQTWQIMGMPVSIEIVGQADKQIFQSVQDYFRYVDGKYSPYKSDSEVSRINAGLPRTEWSREMKDIWRRCQTTKRQTKGYFDAMHESRFDPSGLVKGWAVQQAADLIKQAGYQDFYVDAGGDVQVSGHNAERQPWTIGIRNPFDRTEIVKTVALSHGGVATSGTYIRGQHIYNPHHSGDLDEVASITVIGPNIYDADRFATAAFAMGLAGIHFIESLPGFEAYMITPEQQGTMTSGFEAYVGVPA
jgi:thiamine biosynthesis lipoprotein